jgi:hypothetical protein
MGEEMVSRDVLRQIQGRPLSQQEGRRTNNHDGWLLRLPKEKTP